MVGYSDWFIGIIYTKKNAPLYLCAFSYIKLTNIIAMISMNVFLDQINKYNASKNVFLINIPCLNIDF